MTIFRELPNYLGTPAFEAPGVAIYHADCLEALRQLPGGCIDLTVTSPPYNIGKEYEHPLDLNHYLDWSAQWLELVAFATRPNGSFWLNLGYVSVDGKGKAVPLPYLLWDKTPMHLLQEIIWNYGAGVACKTMLSPRNEKFLWYVKNADRYTFNLDSVRDPDVKYPKQKKNGKLKCNPLGKNPTDVWNFPKVTSGADRSSKERTPHPAQFPESVIERIILACSNEGDLVLDPFSGSGTTAAVARRLGRQVVAFELRPDYVRISADRIEDELAWEAVQRSQSELAFAG